MPKEGRDRTAHYKAKFGDGERLAIMTEKLLQQGATLGIAFAFEKIQRVPNTLDSHRLLLWAGSANVQDQVAEALFKTYFEEARDIGSNELLSQIAAQAGMDADNVARRLASDEDVETVAQDIGLAQRMGVTGVPCFIFNNRFAIMGAQPVEVFHQAFDKALEG